MRARKGIVALLILVALGTLAVYRVHKFLTWEHKNGRWYHYGYWDEYLNISNALATLPGVYILGTWCNEDLTLEEFGFYLKVDGTESIHIDFSEDDRTRSLTGEKLVAALRERIGEK